MIQDNLVSTRLDSVTKRLLTSKLNAALLGTGRITAEEIRCVFDDI